MQDYPQKNEITEYIYPYGGGAILDTKEWNFGSYFIKNVEQCYTYQKADKEINTY